jgi:hypothetical protein
MSDIFAAVEQLLSILKACPCGQAFFVIGYRSAVVPKDCGGQVLKARSQERAFFILTPARGCAFLATDFTDCYL